MMIKNYKQTMCVAIICLMYFVGNANASNKDSLNFWANKAVADFDNLKFENALFAHKKILAIDSTNVNSLKMAANILLYNINNYAACSQYLNKLLAQNAKVDEQFAYDFALCNQLQENYKTAIEYYKKVREITKNSSRITLVNKAIVDCEFALSNSAFIDTIIVENIGCKTNSSYDDYSVVATADKIYFTSRKPLFNSSQIDPSDKKFLENIFSAHSHTDNIGKPVLFNFNIDDKTGTIDFQKLHKSMVNAFNDTALLVFTNDNLWYCNKDAAGQWIARDTMAFDKSKLVSQVSFYNNFSNAAICVQPIATNNNRDILLAKKAPDNAWLISNSETSKINTPFDENSPYITKNGNTIYFASNGLPGYGGYDIYKSSFENGAWTEPKNLGQPINSPADDLFFVVDENNTGIAYLNSNRQGGCGMHDIYKIQFISATPYIHKPYQVNISIQKSVDTVGAASKYYWSFSDGSKNMGTNITHSFNKPEKYFATISTSDSWLNEPQIADTTFVIDVTNNVYLSIKSADTLNTNQTVLFDASQTRVRKLSNIKYKWFVNGKLQPNNEISLAKSFANEGLVTIKLLVLINENEFEKPEMYSLYKKVLVVNKQ